MSDSQHKEVMMHKHLFFLLSLSMLTAHTATANPQGMTEQVLKISPAAFYPLHGGVISSFNGCFLSRLGLGGEPDGPMYAGVSLPPGSVITRVVGHFYDITNPSSGPRPKMEFRQHDGTGNLNTLATIINPDMTTDFLAYYPYEVDLDPDFSVMEGDFFDLLFIPQGPTQNANYICGVDVFYQPATP